jgi:hypothetical protein
MAQRLAWLGFDSFVYLLVLFQWLKASTQYFLGWHNNYKSLRIFGADDGNQIRCLLCSQRYQQHVSVCLRVYSLAAQKRPVAFHFLDNLLTDCLRVVRYHQS